ncbi:hypothetical protein GSI_08729 [Ganoderma sinense ZZ0214-1]|uniref:HNH nuclease domain-containing protein n=1 Tax=Ganoderma sinense ZZ0214-1 TaxID=1077348 RepID=A0A2G8S4L0_9APHY|nr:hypothetical protein GSI_08729 [Ganoderma sinense ZZ0214-1]
MNPRDPLSVPTPREILFRGWTVLIKHPGLDVRLLKFPALSADPTGRCGLFCPLVLNACRVLTNNKAEYGADFLATDIQGHNRIRIDDTPLDVDCYYFLGPLELEANRNYPIVKSFCAFIFPSSLPDDWCVIADARQRPIPVLGRAPPASAMSYEVKTRDGRCVITHYCDSTQCAYLIPKAEGVWFASNSMSTFASDNSEVGVDDRGNGILLRADVQLCMDAHGFVFYPADAHSFIAYFLSHDYSDFPELFHRRPATIHPDVPVQFLYARFAYTSINLLLSNDLDAIEEPPRYKAVKARNDLEKAKRKAIQTQTALGAMHESGRNEDDGMSDGSGDLDTSEKADGADMPELPEVEDPPETQTACHVETPHMLRLKSEYIRKNPQVWQTSTTPADAMREDKEGYYATLLTT